MGEVDARAVDLVNAAVITVDLAGTVTGASPFVEDLYGWAPEDLVGRPAAEMAASVIDPKMTREISDAISGGGSWEGVFEVRRKDGTVIMVRAVDVPLMDENGKLSGILSVGLDASAQQDMAQQLDEQTRSAEIFRFLAECTTALSSAQDYSDALAQLARLSAEFIGDVCLIDITDGSTLRRMAAAHRDPARQHLVNKLVGYLPDPGGSHPAVDAVQRGASTYSDTMTDDFLRRTTRDDQHLELVRTLGFQSFMCVPLTARGRILGAITLVSCDHRRRFTADDFDLAHELAWRAALALDNARLFEERARITRVLQASLLPATLPEIEGARLAARYLAAEEGLDVGGDFYDVFDAGYRTWGVTIGDVCGRGPQAATVTGLIRHTLRSLALRERDPAKVLATLNSVLSRDLPDASEFCTVWYSMLRARAEGLVLRSANGGHPAPLLLRGNGVIEEITCAGLVLGPFETGHWTTTTTLLRPGESAVFYTDGVSEARRGEEQFGDSAMRAAVAGMAGADAETIAAALTDAATRFAAAAVPDDMAVLVIQAV